MTQKPPPPSRKFPGLEEIKRRAARPPEEKGRPGRKMKAWTAEELARLSPKDRRRIERRTVAVRKGENSLERVELAPRRLLLTPELIDQLCVNIASGAPLKFCAEAIGVARGTVDEWLLRAQDPKEPDPIYRSLEQSVARARAQAVVGMALAARTGRKGWQGAAWMLERTRPEDFGPPKKQLEHSGPGLGGAIRIVASSVELPEEIPDGHPSLGAGGKASPGPRGDASPRAAQNGHASNGTAPLDFKPGNLSLLAEGVSLPEEDDPD